MDNAAPIQICKFVTFDTDIAIAGGGLTGMTLAIALAKSGFEVTLIDNVPPSMSAQQNFDGRSYALGVASRMLFQTLDLWPILNDNAQPILEIKVSDGRAGEGASPFFMHLDHVEIEEGPMGYMVEDRHLRPALIDQISQTASIDFRAPATVCGNQPGAAGTDINLDDSNSVSAHLLVAADGRNGPLAQRAGLRKIEKIYGQSALVCAIQHERPHQGIAHQFFMPEGPLAILPLRENRSSIVWTEETDAAKKIAAMDSANYLESLRPRIGDFLGDITLAGDRFSYPLALGLAHSFVSDRLVLVGDAAHGIHPIAGQGLNAGLKDLAVLAEVLTDARRRGEDIGSAAVLERFQQWRRFDSVILAAATDGFNQLFSNDNPSIRAIRDVGLGIVGACTPIRRGLIREAAGLTGEVPRLMRGQPL